MNLIANIFYIVSEAMQLISLIIFAILLGILSKNKIKKNRLAPSLITNIAIIVLFLFLYNTSNDSISFFTALIYYSDNIYYDRIY